MLYFDNNPAMSTRISKGKERKKGEGNLLFKFTLKNSTTLRVSISLVSKGEEA